MFDYIFQIEKMVFLKFSAMMVTSGLFIYHIKCFLYWFSTSLSVDSSLVSYTIIYACQYHCIKIQYR